MKKLQIILTFLFYLVFISCSYKQISFDSKKWKAGKNRYYMTDSLIVKFEAEKPNRDEIFSLLGEPDLHGRNTQKHISYFLKSDCLIGLAMHEFVITFNDDGNIETAKVQYSD